MKESYVKSIGCGISDNLANICFIIKNDFSVDSTRYCHYCTYFYSLFQLLTYFIYVLRSGINGDAQLILNDTPRDDWLFKFSSVDRSHIVAVALGPTSEAYNMEKEKNVSLHCMLQEKTIQSLLTTEQLARLASPRTVFVLPSDSTSNLSGPPSSQSCNSI